MDIKNAAANLKSNKRIARNWKVQQLNVLKLQTGFVYHEIQICILGMIFTYIY